MAQLIVRCPFCREELNVEEEWIGMDGECPGCGKTFLISRDSQQSPPPPPEETGTAWESSAAHVEPSENMMPQLQPVQPNTVPGAMPQLQPVQPNTVPGAMPQLRPLQPNTVPGAMPQLQPIQPNAVPGAMPQLRPLQPNAAPGANPPSRSFLFVCPSCTQAVELPIIMQGRQYTCARCGKTATAQGADGPVCPYCGQKVPPTVQSCPYCRTPLAPAAPQTLGAQFKKKISTFAALEPKKQLLVGAAAAGGALFFVVLLTVILLVVFSSRDILGGNFNPAKEVPRLPKLDGVYPFPRGASRAEVQKALRGDWTWDGQEWELRIDGEIVGFVFDENDRLKSIGMETESFSLIQKLWAQAKKHTDAAARHERIPGKEDWEFGGKIGDKTYYYKDLGDITECYILIDDCLIKISWIGHWIGHGRSEEMRQGKGFIFVRWGDDAYRYYRKKY